MKLVLLGTGGLMPTDQAQTMCLMLPEVGVLLDAGSGLYRMYPYLQTSQVEVYLTHEHGDHTSGLIYLFASFLMKQISTAPAGVAETNIRRMVENANTLLHTARIHATQPAIDFLAREYEPYEMNWQVLCDQDQRPLPGGGTLTCFDVGSHGEVGFRLDWPGHSLAYVTDTTAKPGAVYLDQIRGVDVLVHDCNGPDRLAGMMANVHHSSTSAVARLAADAQVSRLILAHQNPYANWSIEQDLPAARAIFPALEIGRDGMEIDF